MRQKAVTIFSRRWFALVQRGLARYERDAIDRAGRDTELTTGTKRIYHGMQLARSTDDGIDRAGWQTTRAADAALGVDVGDLGGLLATTFRIECERRHIEQGSELYDRLAAARRAAIDERFTASDGFGIGPAALIPAARALRLRQKGIDLLGRDGHAERAIS